MLFFTALRLSFYVLLSQKLIYKIAAMAKMDINEDLFDIDEDVENLDSDED